MKIVRDLDESVWSAFVRTQPGANIFHTPEMFRVFSRAERHQPELWAVVDRAGAPLALHTPVTVDLFKGPLKRATTRFVSYGGFLVRPDATGRNALSMLLEEYVGAKRGRGLFTEVRNLRDASEFREPLDRAGFHFEEHLNFEIPLDRSAEEVQAGISRRLRRRLRSALRKDIVQIREIHDPGELEHFLHPLRQSYRRARIPLADRSLFEAALEELAPRGMARLAIAEIDGKAASVSIDLAFRERLYGWYGGVDRSYSRFLPNELLTWNILEWGIENGYRVYDYGGAGSPTETYGVRDHKARFGGELCAYGRYVCVHSPFLLRTSRMGYQTIRGALSLARRFVGGR